MYEIDNQKFGAFVAMLRKEKGYTQKELAERLFLSDKAVSKWERGLSLPDIALLEPLAQILDVTVAEIPLCLYLTRKTGLFLPIILNTILGIFLPIILGNTAAWWFVSYCYVAKLAEPLMGIEINGTFASTYGFSITILVPIMLSILFFIIFSFTDAEDFSKRRQAK